MSSHSVLVNIVFLMKHPTLEVQPWEITFQSGDTVYILTPQPESTLHMGKVEVYASPEAGHIKEGFPLHYLFINLQDMPRFLETLAQGTANESPEACTIQSWCTSTIGALNEETFLYLQLVGFPNVVLVDWYSLEDVNDSVLQECIDEMMPRRSKRLQAKQK